MTCKWSLSRFQLRGVSWIVVILLLQFDDGLSLNDEGLALLEFCSKVDIDPHDALKNWNSKDGDPCSWSGVSCIDGKVVTLNLKELSLGGTLAPELGKLSRLKFLILYNNNFSGIIPKEFGQLTMLEVLDLRGNNLSGTIPTEIGEIKSLRNLLICDVKFQSSIPLLEKLIGLSQLKCDQNISCNMAMGTDNMNRKVKNCQQLKKGYTVALPTKVKVLYFLDMLPRLNFKSLSLGLGAKLGVNIPGLPEPYIEQNMQLTANSVHRILLQQSTNLAAIPLGDSPPQEAIPLVISIGSGAFPAVPNSSGVQAPVLVPKDQKTSSHSPGPEFSEETTSQNNDTSNGMLKKLVLALPICAILAILIAGIIMWRQQNTPAVIGPWKTGLSGPLQKALIAGVSKLNRSELEAACEDFSNIICSYPVCTIYKGTLSSGVEIAVVSTAVESKDWSKRSEAYFRKKVDMLSRINHKNFSNLLGYCEENEPFTRMIVLEYAPNGNLSEHLHGKEFEPLDWSSRMRIIMGTAYCLQYLHHEINPPVVLGDMQSKSIYLTDDYAAKLCDRNMWIEIAERRNKSADEDNDPSDSSRVNPETNVYSFGIIMLETISGKLPHSQDEGSILNWASEYLNDKHNFKNLVDPALKSFKDDELEIVCDAIQECIHGDPKDRPNMMEVTAKLRDGLGITSEAAHPRLSPLWWAELEILSVEAS